MKKILYTFLLSTFLLVGCEDFVDIEQPGRLGADQAFSNVADLELGLLDVYNRFDVTSAIKFNAVAGDEISIGFDNGGQDIDLFNWRINAAGFESDGPWIRFYGALNAASRVIEAGNGLTVDAADQDTWNEIMGQAYALRAWAHFHLLSYYSADITDDNSTGIIIVNFVPETSQQLARNTTGEVFAAIDADIVSAEGLLTEQSNPTFVSLDFLTALKARMAAYRGNYTQADGFAATLLASYDIAARDEYEDVFDDASNAGIIFKLERTIGDSFDNQSISARGGGWAGALFAFVTAAVDGSPYLEMSNGLFDALSTDDIRYNVLVHPSAILTGAVDSEDDNIIPVGKYSGSEGQDLMNDLKVFRAEEMVFIRAEAAAASNQLATAASFIQQIRDARYAAGTAPTAGPYASSEAAFMDILAERRLELAYEGHRWVDIRNLGARAGIVGIERVAADCATFGACQLQLSDVRLQALPIPLDELDANSVIQQNVGY